MEIAIVGAGVAGSSLLKALIKHPNFKKEDRIDVYEKREILGSGMPYDPTETDSVMLNIVPESLSVEADNPNDFVEWLDEHYKEPKNFEGLVSRPQFGKYLVERFTPYYAHEQVTHIQDVVVDLDVFDAETKQLAEANKDGDYVYRLKTRAGWQEKLYDAVFLAVGHPDYNDFYDLKGTTNYVHNPYPMNKKLAPFSNDQEIAVIGSGATGIDLMRFFSTHYDLENPLTYFDVKEPFFSPNIHYKKGEIPFSLTLGWIQEQKEKHGGFIPLNLIIETVKADLQKVGVEIRPVYDRYHPRTLEAYREAVETEDQELAAIQQYASLSVQVLDELYNALSGLDRSYYYQHYYDMMSFFKNKVPYLTYKWLIEQIDAGKIKAYATLQDVQVLENGRFQMVTGQGKAKADVVINATGFNANLESLSKDFELIGNLFDKRIILPQKSGRFVLIDWPQSRVVNQRFGRMEHLYFFGLLIGGTQHENNDAPQIIRHSRRTANTFMNQLNR